MTAMRSTRLPGRDPELCVRAALASTATALAGGVVAAQYVGSGLYGSVASAVVGVLTGASAGGRPGTLDRARGATHPGAGGGVRRARRAALDPAS